MPSKKKQQAYMCSTVYELAVCALTAYSVLMSTSKKQTSKYFIVRPKVDQRAGLPSLSH